MAFLRTSVSRQHFIATRTFEKNDKFIKRATVFMMSSRTTSRNKNDGTLLSDNDKDSNSIGCNLTPLSQLPSSALSPSSIANLPLSSSTSHHVKQQTITVRNNSTVELLSSNKVMKQRENNNNNNNRSNKGGVNPQHHLELDSNLGCLRVSNDGPILLDHIPSGTWSSSPLVTTDSETNCDSSGMFLQTLIPQSSSNNAALHNMNYFVHSLGKLPEKTRILSAARVSKYWMGPAFENIPIDTQFLFLELQRMALNS